MTIRSYTKQALLWAHLLLCAVLFGGSIYETIVINAAWSASLPDSLRFMTASRYPVDPGRFWRGLGPGPSLALIGALAVNWKSAARRKWLLVSLACYLVFVLTAFVYFIPTLKIMFAPDGGGLDGEELTRLANHWLAGNWGRLLLSLLNLIASAQALKAAPPG